MVLKAVQCCLLLLASLTSSAQMEQWSYYQHQSNIYFDQDRLKQAELYADSALQLAVRSNRPDSIANACRWLSEIHFAKGEYKKALMDLRQSMVYSDSSAFLEREAKEKEWRLKLTLDSVSRQREIELLQNDYKKQEYMASQDRQNSLVIFFGTLALSIISILFFYRKNLLLKTDLDKSRDEILHAQSFNQKLYAVLTTDLENFPDPESLRIKLNHVIRWVGYQARVKAFYPSEFDCKKLVEEVIGRFQSEISDKRIAFELFIPEAQFAFADRDMIAIVLESLLSNAIRYSRPGSSITIFCGKKDDLVTLGIKDSGAGISEARVQNLFGATNGLKKESESDQGGEGIGLVLSRDLVERNGGRIYVESVMGQGSTFTFSIPAKKID